MKKWKIFAYLTRNFIKITLQNIFKSNIIERYAIRPHCLTSLCLAEFAAFYYKDYKKDCAETADAQPEVLTDDVIEVQLEDSTDSNCTSVILPDKIQLLNSNEVMKCRKVRLL